ncbi:carbohydrate kinase, FGGY family protein [Rhodovulum sulfidophilum]|uniref:Carbohydrate kinase, FGGY family protein n=1 Tax=Rhodovulum sulfidophilum TaxID=35806 RepID=A0A0D6B6L4_RHOSU|nr:carbohydrate kinase, FGGY family protein [Rhodovulum sulfidophilum]
MVGMLRLPPHTGAVVEIEPAMFLPLVRNPEPLAPPNACHSLLVRLPRYGNRPIKGAEAASEGERMAGKAVFGLTLDEPILTEAARRVKGVSGKVRGPFPP